MGQNEVLDIVRCMIGELGIGCRPNKDGTISIYRWLEGKVAVLLDCLDQRCVVAAYMGERKKIDAYIRSYDLHDAKHFEDLRTMILEVSHRPVTMHVTEAKMVSYYLETHIVIGQPSGLVCTAQDLKMEMQKLGFWASVLTEDESTEEKAGDLIFTTREADSDVVIALTTMKTALKYLKERHASIKRYKIEAAVVDSKRDDHLFPLIAS